MPTLRTLLDSLALAVMWFTRLPIPWRVHNASEVQQQALAWTPLVGLVVGMAGNAVGWGLVHAPALGALACTAVIVLFTGALHEDGWADGWDALGAGGDTTRALSVLKDPRLGTFGVTALVFSLSVQGLACWQVISSQAWYILPLLHASSRLSLPLLAWTLPYVRPAEQGKANFLRTPVCAWAWVLWGLQVVLWIGILVYNPFLPLVPALGAALLPIAAALPWYRKLGGATGDVYGFCQQAGLLGSMVLWMGWLPCA